MGWLPQATRRDIGAPNNYSNGAMHSYAGVVLHVNDADSGDLFDWITGGSSDMSCHFQVLKDGTIYQYIDTAYSSWCQGDGNDDYLSIETQGFPAEELTDAQLASCAAIMRFAHLQHGIALQVADAVGDTGLAWHGMGGAGWGGHPGCPGDARRAQRSKILALSQGVDPTEGDVMTDAQYAELKSELAALAGAVAAIAQNVKDTRGASVEIRTDVTNDSIPQRAARYVTGSLPLPGSQPGLNLPAVVQQVVAQVNAQTDAKLGALKAELKAAILSHPAAASAADLTPVLERLDTLARQLTPSG